MADEHKPKKPTDSNISRDWEAVSESDVEQKLAQAAELASELAGEISPAPADGRGLDRIRGDDPLQSIEKGLDAELGELEQLVGQAKAEVGNDAATRDPTRTGSGPAAVPDFMSEFTSPPPPQQEGIGGSSGDVGGACVELSGGALQLVAGAGASGAIAGAKPPTPINAGTGTATASTASANAGGTAAAGPAAARIVKPGVVGTKGTATGSPDKRGNPAATKEPSLDPDATASPADASPNSAAAEERSVHPDTLLLKLCAHGVHALEKIDRPFARLGGKVRHIVGLIAITIAIMSIVVFILSMM